MTIGDKRAAALSLVDECTTMLKVAECHLARGDISAAEAMLARARAAEAGRHREARRVVTAAAADLTWSREDRMRVRRAHAHGRSDPDGARSPQTAA